MRKAKFAAIVFGGVSTCIFGGLLGVYATAPLVSSVTPKNDVESIYEVESETLANVAAVTSIRSTAVTTTSKKTTSYYSFKSTTTTSAPVTDLADADVYVDLTRVIPAIAENYYQEPTEPATEPWTSPATEAWTEWTEPSTEYQEPTTVPETTQPETEYSEPATEAPTEPATEPQTEPATEPDVVEVDGSANYLPISDEDFVILCNAVAHEAGCNWISEYDKALVVEVIMNRVYSPLYPNSITGVLTQAYQFSGSSSYVYLGTYSASVTESVKNAVNLYFSDPDSFNHGYYGFYGDGFRNYFY